MSESVSSFGSHFLLGQGNLAAVLAQFRRHEGQVELLVDLILSRTGNPSPALEKPVFIELPAAVIGDPAQCNVVGLGPGEIHQRRAIAALRDDSKIDLKPRAQHDGRSRRTMGENVRDVLVGDEAIADGRTVARGDEDIKIPDRIATAAVASGRHDLTLVQVLAQEADERLRLRLGNRELEAFLARRLAERGKKLLLDLAPKAAEFTQPTAFGGTAKVRDRANAELVIEQLDTLGPETGKCGHLAEIAWQLTLQALQEIEPSAIDDAGDLARQVLADAGQLREILPPFSRVVMLLGNPSITRAARRYARVRNGLSPLISSSSAVWSNMAAISAFWTGIGVSSVLQGCACDALRIGVRGSVSPRRPSALMQIRDLIPSAAPSLPSWPEPQSLAF